MNYEILKIDQTENIALVTISRPQAMNALNTRFFEEMDQAVAEFKADTDLRAIIITGEGKAFVAGADIAEMANKTAEEGSVFSAKGQNTFSSFSTLNVPVIAAINGFALGGGLELAMGCDFRIASTKAKFGQPEVSLGLIPGFAGTQRLARLIGIADALHLLMTADMIGAEEALRLKLVQKVVEPEVLLDTCITIAKNIASKGPQAIKAVKQTTINGYDMPFVEGEKLEASQFGTLFGKGSEGEEGMKAFLEKRKPNW
ncbi:MAG: enoyl-CoA hydratase/isomerase family protein [Bacteroidales bacterium]|nr:enoyl-CoA hydratase/isomerase family protein [Bacteroidales bacterium]